MEELQQNSGEDTARLRHAFLVAVSFVVLLWLIKIAEKMFGLSLVQYGVYPQQLSGLAGVLWAPLIHGSLVHLLSNTAPLVILGTALLYGYPQSARIVLPVLYVCTGLGVWLFARPAYHLGASGLTFGMMFFVFTIGALRWDPRAIALSLIVFLLYGGMVWGIFPGDPDVSYETHFFGAITGIFLALILRNYDPPPPAKKYSWELEEDDA